jgi:hypothetical protein
MIIMQNVQASGNTIDKKHQGGATQSATAYDASAKPLGILTRTHSTLTGASVSSPKIIRSHDYILQDQSAKLLPKERVSNCLKKRITVNKPISIAYNPNRDKAHYFNVQRCGSMCMCKPCAKIVTEKRRSELKKGTKTWKDKGGFLYFISLTSRHNSNTHFKTLKQGQSKAQNYFFTGGKAEKLFERLGKVGHITSNETTYSPTNGHHPHKHILIFSDKELSGFELYNLQKELALHWQHCCELAGIELPDLKHGLDLRDGTHVAEYISKWGIEEEMTKSQQKLGKNGSYSPWDLLELSIEDKPLSNGKLPSKLFQEYALVFKGARLLSWSRGLKKLLNVLDLSDDELINETDKQSFIVLDVSTLTFALIKKYQVRHLYLDWVLADIKQFGLDNLAKIDYKDNYDRSVVKKNIDSLFLKELE